MDLHMKGKTAVITGGVQGIGFEVAKELALAGVNLVLADVNAEAGGAAVQALSPTTPTLFVSTDLTRPDSVQSLVKAALARFGTIHYFVNSAAILDDKTFEESSPDDWKRMLDVCLLGPMHCLHAVIPVMRAQKFGRIVCFSSDSARIGQARLSYYAAAKAGAAAVYVEILSKHGIRVPAPAKSEAADSGESEASNDAA